MQTQPNDTAKAVIVTGASRGIGRAIALRLARDGFNVAVGFAGNQQLADEVVQGCSTQGARAISVQADVADEHAVAAMFSATEKTFGGIHAVVHCAGIMTLFHIMNGEVAEFDKIIATNLRGTFLVLQQAARHLGEGGRIVAMSSSVVVPAFPGYGPYIASKTGVESLVRVLAHELRGRAITVNAVAPGPTATDLFMEGKSEEQVAHLAKLPPLERLGEPEDIAGAVAFLLGPDGGWVNAQVLRVNGGFV